MLTNRFSVFVGAPYYLPGYRAGGPIRSIANMVGNLKDRIDFSVVTASNDLLVSSDYSGVEVDAWNDKDGARVFYASRANRNLFSWISIFSKKDFDVLYLNSLFSIRFSFLMLLAVRFLRHRARVVLAPRGELMPGALAIKPAKKKFFLAVVKFLGIYKNIVWHATSPGEVEDIRRVFGESSVIKFSENLSSKIDKNIGVSSETWTFPLRLVFLSRISRKKNLDYALRVLARARIPVVFDVWGTAEDLKYLEECKALVSALPEFVSVAFKGEVEHHLVSGILASYDLFFFPTKGENYGHVIAEAVSVGTPVLISDQTPWSDLTGQGVGWDIPLREENAFVDAIEAASQRCAADREGWRSKVRDYAESKLCDKNKIDAAFKLFSIN